MNHFAQRKIPHTHSETRERKKSRKSERERPVCVHSVESLKSFFSHSARKQPDNDDCYFFHCRGMSEI